MFRNLFIAAPIVGGVAPAGAGLFLPVALFTLTPWVSHMARLLRPVDRGELGGFLSETVFQTTGGCVGAAVTGMSTLPLHAPLLISVWKTPVRTPFGPGV